MSDSVSRFLTAHQHSWLYTVPFPGASAHGAAHGTLVAAMLYIGFHGLPDRATDTGSAWLYGFNAGDENGRQHVLKSRVKGYNLSDCVITAGLTVRSLQSDEWM